MSDYCVYRHIFPNGKSYIGISKDAEKRWNGGAGYNTQPKMARAINKYGWDNVKHEILSERLTKELAQQLEKHYIAEYDSIRNGYNTSIGGDEFNSSYISGYVLSMAAAAKRYMKWVLLSNLVYEDRYNKEAADFWNEANKAVLQKHGIFSATDEREVAEYWHYMSEYFNLYKMVQEGKNTDDWKEVPFEDAVYDYLFGERG